MTKGDDCTLGARHAEAIQAMEREQMRLHEVDQEQWTAINAVRNRLPIWATLLISLLMAALGVLAAAAAK